MVAAGKTIKVKKIGQEKKTTKKSNRELKKRKGKCQQLLQERWQEKIIRIKVVSF